MNRNEPGRSGSHYSPTTAPNYSRSFTVHSRARERELSVTIVNKTSFNVGPLYVKLEAVKLYGLIPIMAGNFYGQLVHGLHARPPQRHRPARVQDDRHPHAAAGPLVAGSEHARLVNFYCC